MLAPLDHILIHVFSFDKFPIREFMFTFLHATFSYFVVLILADDVHDAAGKTAQDIAWVEK